MNLRLRAISAFGLAFATWCEPAFAESPREALQSANELLSAGSYDEALPRLEAAAEADDPALRAPALHNQAIALFRLGRYADARETWVRLLADADAKLEARTRYNIGNTHYQETLRALQAPTDAAAQPTPLSGLLAQLDKAILQYRDAIRLDPSLVDARANLELALRLRDALKNQSQPQSQPSSQPSQQPPPDSQPSDDDQDDASNDSQQNKEQQQKNQQDKQKQDDEEQGQQSQQQEGGEGVGDGQPEDEENANGNRNSGASSENQNVNGNGNENASGGQSGSDGNENANARPNSSESQEKSLESPDPAKSQPLEPAQENGNGNTSGAPAPLTGASDAEPADPAEEPPPGATVLPRSEAERLLQMIRDAEKARREAIRTRMRMRQPPVERDW
jgi:Ca-activated chloride channel family protein